ncbi:alpha/beta hydrolase [Paenibacillus luteus]|uniref:alpha/beta hydrolase n=1 Tax=Paenibacillus luteus TaxID=2545753 RepID=UPI001144072C|nr:alpha/beta hydrolase-fold protein [Paenibacillus luteus]
MGILRFNYRSEILSLTTNITICYPTGNLTSSLGYEDPHSEIRRKKAYCPGMKFQTVYLLHGGGEDDTVPYRYTQLEEYAERNMVMLVSPSVNDSLYANTKYGFKYFDYLTQELPLVVQSLFASAPGRSHTFAVGLAMGGNGALALGLMRPDLYEAVVDLSGGIGMTLDREGYKESLNWEFPLVRNTLPGEDEYIGSEHDLRYHAERIRLEGKKAPTFFIGVGTEDFIRDRVYQDYAVLAELGFDTRYEEAPGLGHDYRFWNAYLDKALSSWLPLKRAPIYGV